MVVDIEQWRESSRTTQGFSSRKVKEITTRKLTAKEQEDYKQVWRMYSYRYDSLDAMIGEEKRIVGEDWAEKLLQIISKFHKK